MFNAILALLKLLLEIVGAVAKKLGILIFIGGLLTAITVVTLIVALDNFVG